MDATRRCRRGRGPAALLLLCALALPAAGQTDTETLDEALRKRWSAILDEVAPAHGLRAEGGHLAGDAAAKGAAYQEALRRLQQDPALLQLVYGDPAHADYQRLVAERVREQDRDFIKQLQETNQAGPPAASVNSRSSNPAAGNLTEKSGFAQFLALALDGSTLVSADDSAVSLNLSALALFSLADPDVYSELYRYQQHSLLRRIGGTVVFGAKVPEKEITGLSSLPDFDKLLDVFVWDVKIRLLGNRDPRDRRWYPLTLGRGGLSSQMATTVGSLLPAEDFPLVQPALTRLVDPADIKRRVSRSPQLTAKVTGTHLTKETGKNKYGGGLLFDAGLGGADLTANILYSVTDDVRLGAANVFQVKQWSFSASLTGRLAQDALVEGKAVDWSSGVVVNRFADKARIPVPAQDTWKAFTTFDIPVSKTARVPVSVVYTNDPNALQKSKYVSGQIGISYDFTALTSLFRSGK
jgi:hypothetical protein